MSSVANHPRWHRAGSLDPAFGSGGRLEADLDAPLPGGDFLVDGQASGWEEIDADGAVIESVPDPSLPGFGPIFHQGFTVDPAGRVLLYGNEVSGQSSGPIIIRTDLNGSPDPSFGSGGTVAVPVDPTSIAFQQDGKLLILVDEYPQPFQILRLNENGSIDDTFNNGAVETWTGTNVPDSDAPGMASVTVQPDGKILVYGEADRPMLLRYNSDGSPDLTFGSGGQVLLSNRLTWAGNAVVQPDGKIDLSAGNAQAGIVEQLNADGSLNKSFGQRGRAVVTFLSGGYYFSQDLTIDQSGRILVSGEQQFGQRGGGGVGKPYRYATDYVGVLQLSSSGRREVAFGNRGVAVRLADSGSLASSVAMTSFLSGNDLLVSGLEYSIAPLTSTFAFLDSREMI